MIRALVHGTGRMAHRILAQIPELENYEIVAIVSRSQAPDLTAIEWSDSLDDYASGVDLLIDFTLPGGTRLAAQWCERNGVALLSGTTGLTDEDLTALEKAALKVPVLWAPNLSYGVALLAKLVGQAAASLGVRANISITDVHHQHKIDSPSGTALALATAVMEGRSVPLEDLLEPDRLESLSKDGEGELAFTSVREGDVVGDHTVSFDLQDEVIELTHKALDRNVFAKGALKAGEWLVTQKPGYYSTRDWLGID
jgi:4-hydroxy-tetrahydrodipicolinate reductase